MGIADGFSGEVHSHERSSPHHRSNAQRLAATSDLPWAATGYPNAVTLGVQSYLKWGGLRARAHELDASNVFGATQK